MLSHVERLRRSLWICTVLFDVLSLLPPLAKSTFFSRWSLMDDEQVLDLITVNVLPLTVFNLVWVVSNGRLTKKETFGFVFMLAMWANGHGIHLAANAISNNMERTGLDLYVTGRVFEVTHFYDEDLGHYLWFTGVIGCSVALLVAQSRSPLPPEFSDVASSRTSASASASASASVAAAAAAPAAFTVGKQKRSPRSRSPAARQSVDRSPSTAPKRVRETKRVLGEGETGRTSVPSFLQVAFSFLLPETILGLFHGFVHFCMTVEGGVVSVAGTYMASAIFLMAHFVYQDLHGDWRRVPVIYHYTLAYVISLILFAVWGVAHGGRMPEFSEVLTVFEHKTAPV